MSDETPTQRFPESGGDVPTQRLPEVVPPTGPSAPVATTELAEERTKSRTLLIVLLTVGGLLLAAIIVLLVILLGGDNTPAAAPTNSSTPSASPTASATPTPTPTPTETETEEQPPPPPPPPAPTPIESFIASVSDAGCTSDADMPEVVFAWETTAASVTFAVGNPNAELAPYQSGLPSTGGITVNYQCSEDGPDQIYSIAAIGPGGDVVDRRTITITD